MSTLTLTFDTQAHDFGPVTKGTVSIGFDYGPTPTLTEKLRLGPSTSGYFEEIPWVNGQTVETSEDQAKAFEVAFNRDYRFVGGASGTKNLSAVKVGNVVTITATIGTFSSFVYDGDAVVIGFSINNSVQESLVDLTVTRNPTVGDCVNIQYSATATGGTSPYILKNGATVIDASWDGTAQTFNIARASIIASITATDTLSAVGTDTFAVPRILKEGDFSISTINYESSSDVTINRVTTISGTAPLQYSLDNTSETTGQNYQSANVFSGVIAGSYKLFIKDAYGCEISKLVTVTGFQDATVAEKPLYFDIPEGQSIIFSKMPTYTPLVKKNYFNSRSTNSNKFINRKAKHYFDTVDGVNGIQFKSSYDYHTITLHGCTDGSAVNVPNIKIQENLGVVEKLDCTLFDINGKTGVYFQGGNTYIPDTTTILGASEYNTTTPIWAEVGQVVSLEGLGSFTIESEGYDSIRGGYFVVDLITLTDTASKIQVTYNAQDYNVYEFYFDVNLIPSGGAYIVAEKGFDGSAVEGDPWVSEILELREDTEDDILLQWSDTKNKGDIVFQSGISYLARLEGEISVDWDITAETFPGDNEEFSLEQKAFLEFEILFEAITTKQVTQLNIAAGLDGFMANNLSMKKKKTPEIKKLGKSNLYTWKGAFGFGANILAVKQDEIVLSVGTGVVGGGSTGVTEAPDLTGIILWKDTNGKLIKLDTNITKQ